ncbi:MAG: hypothetical protein EOO65_06200 [Methanosarcinales archaeon]|nr:MAG: hypothetical protein EOO65_06200 [Methanosarcinales archaeon]
MRLLNREPCFHGWGLRHRLSCYKREVHEAAFDMLNKHNCYMCADTVSTATGARGNATLPRSHSSSSGDGKGNVCPMSDVADTMMLPTSPQSFASLAELDARFWFPNQAARDDAFSVYLHARNERVAHATNI